MCNFVDFVLSMQREQQQNIYLKTAWHTFFQGQKKQVASTVATYATCHVLIINEYVSVVK
jgi:hypothetical protein